MSDWEAELNRIRRENARQQPDESAAPQSGRVDQLLHEVEALRHLRDMRRLLLGGVGRIELFEDAGGYDLVLALMWDGPISRARPPKAEARDGYHIFIGVRNNRLFVNNRPLTPANSDTLKAALLQAARRPGHRRNLTN